MIKITDAWKDMINKAFEEKVSCLVGTASADGQPQISIKGSVVVFRDDTLAYWERAMRSALEHVRENPKVVIYYRNPARADELPRGAALRFYGTASVHEKGPLREEVRSMIVPAELERDPDNIGAAIVIKVDRIIALSGEVLQSKDD